MSFFENNPLPSVDTINRAVDPSGNTLLHKMCLHDSTTPADIQRMIAAGANINALDKNGQPPLAMAIRFTRADLIGTLLDLGAKPVFKIPEEKTFNALYLAIHLGHTGILKTLLSFENVCAGLSQTGVNYQGFSDQLFPLHLAAKKSMTEACALLLEAGALIDLSCSNANYELALHVAIDSENTPTIELLLNAGADFEKSSALNGKRALHLAAEYTNKGLVENLLKRGAKVNARTKNNKTPLHYAAEGHSFRHDMCVRALIAAGADINVRDNDLKTPLMYTAHIANNNVIQLLIEKGAEPLLTDQFNRCALYYAKNTHMHHSSRDLAVKDIQTAQEKAISVARQKSYQKYKNARKNNKNGRTP